jgi:hypothetical protein
MRAAPAIRIRARFAARGLKARGFFETQMNFVASRHVARANQDGRARHREYQPMISGRKDKGSSETDEPWRLPGQASQESEQKPPPKRDVEEDYPPDGAH